MGRASWILCLYLPTLALGVWATSCGDDDQNPPPATATDASLDVTSNADSAGPGSDASPAAEAGADAGSDAPSDAGPDVTTCTGLTFDDGGPFLATKPYLQASDSPFASCTFTHYYHLATFEGDSGLPPGTTGVGGSKYPGTGNTSGIVDSVDGDDGFPDGAPPDSGSAHPCPGCQSYFGAIDFSFDETTLGALPTHAGLVWTDDCNGCTVTVNAYMTDGGLIGTQSVPGIGTSGISGETDEDRFFGLVWDGGIKRLTLTHTGGGIEVDHLQIGR